MTTEFQLVFEEFSAELDALLESAMGPEGRGHGELTPAARIAAANAATLLLSAVFEEYIRQQVRVAFREKARRATTFNDFPPSLAAKVWRRTLESLARTDLREIEGNARLFEERFAAAVAFSVRKDIASEVSDAISHNDNNMRPSQITDLFSQIGVSSILGKACASQNLMQHLDLEDPNEARMLLVARIEDFFRRRNKIAHAITLGSSSGPMEISDDIRMFRALSLALYLALEAEFPLIEQGLLAD